MHNALFQHVKSKKTYWPLPGSCRPIFILLLHISLLQQNHPVKSTRIKVARWACFVGDADLSLSEMYLNYLHPHFFRSTFVLDWTRFQCRKQRIYKPLTISRWNIEIRVSFTWLFDLSIGSSIQKPFKNVTYSILSLTYKRQFRRLKPSSRSQNVQHLVQFLQKWMQLKHFHHDELENWYCASNSQILDFLLFLVAFTWK